jgi:predicted metal-dependent hydrolase
MIEYLVVHELVHLIEPHHTNAFWHGVERVVSDWCDAYGRLRLRKQWLARMGQVLTLRIGEAYDQQNNI